MKISLIQVILAVSMILIIVCIMTAENRERKVPNINFALNRQINKSNPRKDEMMHVFSNTAVPGWKWGNVYGGG
jgi:hypothetical protein